MTKINLNFSGDKILSLVLLTLRAAEHMTQLRLHLQLISKFIEQGEGAQSVNRRKRDWKQNFADFIFLNKTGCIENISQINPYF